MNKSILRWLSSFFWSFLLSSFITIILDKLVPEVISRLNFSEDNSLISLYGGIKGVAFELILLLFLTLLINLYKKYKSYNKILDNFEKHRDDINNSNIFAVFVQYIKDIAKNVLKLGKLEIIDSQNDNPVDLAFEITTIEAKKIEDGTYIKIPKEAISRVRRDRILKLVSSIFNHKVVLFYATEFNLLSVIKDNAKWDYDEKYRKRLQRRKIKDKKRIIVVNRQDMKYLDKMYKDRVKQYLNWHSGNQWKAIIYAVDQSVYPLKLNTFNNRIGNNCNELTDFVLVEYSNQESIVFAQNDKEQCKFFDNSNMPETIADYKEWFNLLWEIPTNLKSADYDRYEVNSDSILRIINTLC